MAITIEQITNNTDTGIFDVLLAKVQKHLDEQFQAKRVTSQQYAEVYLANMSNVLSQSIQFATAIETANNQAELIKAQTEQVEAEIAKSLVEKQLLDSKLLLAAKELIEADKKIQLLELQILRSDNENLLILAKVDTEKAQIVDTINGVPVAGVVGKQKALFDAQKSGFARDAEQKLLKIFVDAWSVDKSTDPDAIDRNLTGLYDTNIKQVVNKALEGIGTTSVGLTP